MLFLYRVTVKIRLPTTSTRSDASDASDATPRDSPSVPKPHGPQPTPTSVHTLIPRIHPPCYAATHSDLDRRTSPGDLKYPIHCLHHLRPLDLLPPTSIQTLVAALPTAAVVSANLTALFSWALPSHATSVTASSSYPGSLLMSAHLSTPPRPRVRSPIQP